MTRPAFPGVALAWAVWGCALVLALPWFTHLAVPLTLLVSVAVTWVLAPGPRRGPGTPVVLTSLGLLAVWMFLGVLQQRQSLGGQVLWVLPEFDSDSGSTLGGPVRTGQLVFALENGLTSVGLCAAAALALRVVAAGEWHDLARLLLGRGAPVVTGSLHVAHARQDEASAHAARRAHGIALGAGSWGAAFRTATRAAAAQEAVDATLPRSRFGWLRLPVALALSLAVAASAVVPGGWSGPVLLAVAAAVMTLLGVLLWRGDRPRWSLRLVPPVVGTCALAGAGHFGAVTDPVLACCALLVLPAATLFTWEKP